jgi:spermidine synthase
LVTGVAVAVPASQQLWAKLHGSRPQEIIVDEGASGLAVLKGAVENLGPNNPVWVFNNGLGQSYLPYGGVHSQLGMFAVLLHPHPEQIAVIGLGSGDTIYTLAGSPHTRELTCIEIVEPAFRNLKQLAARTKYPALGSLLTDARLRWVFTDGRAYILRSRKKFDVIEADALRPTSAYAGNLYSAQYFQTLKRRLKPDGLAVTWVPSGRVLFSFLQAFPYTVLVDGIAIGSQQPIPVEPDEISRRLHDPFTAAHYARTGNDLQPLISKLMAKDFARYSPPAGPVVPQDMNSDFFPKDEYMVPPSQ